MNKKVIVAGLLSAALCMPIAACGGSSTSSSDAGSSSGSATTSTQSGDFDANATYVGQWRGSVAITGQTVYGNAGGNEPMLDVVFNDDGTCEVTPLEAHADLLTDKGTWEGDAEKVVLHLSSKDITLTLKDQATMEGNAADFDIKDFDVISFDFYG